MPEPDLREAFRIATDHVAPVPGALDRQLRHQRRRAIRRKAGAFLAVAAVFALIAAVILATNPDPDDDIAVPAPPLEGLFSVDVATGEMTPFHDPGEGTWGFHISPDGTRLLMSWRDHEHAGQHRIWIANTDGTDATVLVQEDAQGGTWLDDERIVYVGLGDGDTRQVQVLDLTTGERTQLTDEPSDAFDPAVSADGGTIVFTTTRPTRTGSAPGGFGTPQQSDPVALVRSIDVATGDVRSLFRTDGWAWGSSISPIDGRVAFVLNVGAGIDEEDATSEIWIVNPDGTGERHIVEADAYGEQWVGNPLWSSDGTVIAYGYDDNGSVDTYLYDLGTGETRSLSPGSPEGWLDDHTLLVGVGDPRG